MEDLLSLAEESEVGKLMYNFPGGDKDIIVEAMGQKKGEVKEVIELCYGRA